MRVRPNHTHFHNMVTGKLPLWVTLCWPKINGEQTSIESRAIFAETSRKGSSSIIVYLFICLYIIVCFEIELNRPRPTLIIFVATLSYSFIRSPSSVLSCSIILPLRDSSLTLFIFRFPWHQPFLPMITPPVTSTSAATFAFFWWA